MSSTFIGAVEKRIERWEYHLKNHLECRATLVKALHMIELIIESPDTRNALLKEIESCDKYIASLQDDIREDRELIIKYIVNRQP